MFLAIYPSLENTFALVRLADILITFSRNEVVQSLTLLENSGFVILIHEFLVSTICLGLITSTERNSFLAAVQDLFVLQ